MGLNKSQFKERVRELMEKSTVDAVKNAGVVYDGLGQTGQEIPDNYVVAKAFVYAFADQMKWDWSPPGSAVPVGWKGLITKIKRFL